MIGQGREAAGDTRGQYDGGHRASLRAVEACPGVTGLDGLKSVQGSHPGCSVSIIF
jgi:hypothetical protein